MWARLKAQRILAKTGSSSSVSQPGVRKSRCQPSSAQRASRRSMRGRIVAEKPGSGGFTGETLMRTPRTPSLSISASSASGAFSSTSTMPRQRAMPDLAHRVEHAGIVAAVGARLHEHEALDAEMLARARDSRRAARAAARSAASRSPRRADSAPPGRTHGNARRRSSAARGTRAVVRVWFNVCVLRLLDRDVRARDDVAPDGDLACEMARHLLRRRGDGERGLLARTPRAAAAGRRRARPRG